MVVLKLTNHYKKPILIFCLILIYNTNIINFKTNCSANIATNKDFTSKKSKSRPYTE
jgi:hypothetical protein